MFGRIGPKSKTAVWPIQVVIGGKLLQHLDQMALIAEVDVVQALSPQGSRQSLGDRVSFRRPIRSPDPDGHWCAIGVFAFSYMLGPGGGPATPQNLIDAEWKGRILSSHPGDDDATLCLYKTYAEQYGWDWIGRLAAQNITFQRGTNSPGEAVDAGTTQIGLAGAETGGADTTTWVTPPEGHPFLAWGQRAAMFKSARHPAAAKLYLNWLLTPEWQAAGQHGWGVRTDVGPTGKQIWDLLDGHAADFVDFMADRAAVERWRQTMVLYFGEVSGPPTPGWLGLAPTSHA